MRSLRHSTDQYRNYLRQDSCLGQPEKLFWALQSARPDPMKDTAYGVLKDFVPFTKRAAIPVSRISQIRFESKEPDSEENVLVHLRRMVVVVTSVTKISIICSE